MNTLVSRQHDIIKRVLQGLNVEVQQILSSQKGYRNTSFPVITTDGRKLNVIFYKSEQGIVQKIKSANVVSNYLANQSFPARKHLGRIFRLTSGDNVSYGAVYTYLPGTTIPWESYTKEHIKLLGQYMSDMHALLQNSNIVPHSSVAATNKQLLLNMEAYFSNAPVKNAMESKLQVRLHPHAIKHFNLVMDALSDIPGQQALHMDFVRGNVLFDFNQQNNLVISGVLDFEKTAYGHRIFDIARTLAFLWVDCKYKPSHKTTKYFCASGYNKRGLSHINTMEIIVSNMPVQALGSLVSFYLLYDFYKFLKHNPYEDLANNQHYLRTRTILLQRGIIL